MVGWDSWSPQTAGLWLESDVNTQPHWLGLPALLLCAPLRACITVNVLSGLEEERQAGWTQCPWEALGVALLSLPLS